LRDNDAVVTAAAAIAVPARDSAIAARDRIDIASVRDASLVTAAVARLTSCPRRRRIQSDDNDDWRTSRQELFDGQCGGSEVRAILAAAA
jgi:hypothetical protein